MSLGLSSFDHNASAKGIMSPQIPAAVLVKEDRADRRLPAFQDSGTVARPSVPHGFYCMIYRQHVFSGRSQSWHWCRNCSQWPDENFSQTNGKPPEGEFSAECKAKQCSGECKQSIATLEEFISEFD